MSDRETVKKIREAVLCCTGGTCSGCPYVSYYDCETKLSADIAAFLEPLTRPLTLEELRERKVVWLEDGGEKEVIPVLTDGISDKFAYFIAPRGMHVHAPLHRYGVTWRAWANEPDDKDRCAKWRDTNDCEPAEV